jgi:hypothetical protein
MLYYLFIIFIILIIIEYFYYNYLIKNKADLFLSQEAQNRINSNIKNETEIIKLFKNKMNERLEMLKKMTYEEWIKFNQKYSILEYNGIKYYIFIYEKSNMNEKFILRSSAQKELLNYNFDIERDLVIDKYLILQMFPPYEHLPQEMYKMSLNKDGFNQISYNWENPFVQRPVKKNSYFTRFNKDSFNGIIGIGYTKQDLGLQYGSIYYDFISNNSLFIFHFLILLVAASLYVISKKEKKDLLVSSGLLFFSWLFLVYQLSLTAGKTNVIIEIDKNQEISQSVLGISFLVAVNIFIINSLNAAKSISKDGYAMRKKVVCLFCSAVLFLLLSLCKFNNYKDIESLRSIRINNQIFFNYSVFYNFMICVIFLYYILSS